jgi:outer membrane protein OmpA-like peptidoglycan-associated protein
VRRVALAVAALCAFAGIPAAHAAVEGPSSREIPVAAVFTYHPAQDSSQGVVHGAINAVVRIPGGTAVFYSLGGAADNYATNMPSVGLHTPYNPMAAWAVGIVDTQGGKYYLPLSTAERDCLCSRVSDIGDVPGPKTPLVGWAVLPPLPKGLKHVTVMFGWGNVLFGIPVTDTLPRPIVRTTPVKLGSGWPALPSKATIEAADASLSTRPLASNTANPQAATKTTPETTSIALNSSVLFDFDKAVLTPQADGVLADAAHKISTSGAGTVSIVGYTDDVGDAGYNQTLSEERAQGVRDALQKLVGDAGVTFQASGMGEQNPIADNSTDAGRALNRRVTITFTKEGK